MLENLLDPLFLFFGVGLLAGWWKSDIRLPDAIYQLLSTYLLLAIGLKGGVELAHAPLAALLWPAAGTLALGIGLSVAAFAAALFLGRLARADAASLAAHYGSVSAVTFAAALTYAQRAGHPGEGYLPVLLVILEVPAILIAVVLHRLGRPAQAAGGAGLPTVLREVLTNRSVFLLLAGLLVGYLTGPARFAPFEVLFREAFKPILAFFILEMGWVASGRLGEVRKAGPFIVSFALLWPIAAGCLGAWVGLATGLSVGGATVLAAMAASASYIAAPAAVRLAIPEANVALSIAAALGLTFPFNLALGLPLFHRWVEWLGRTGN